MEKVRKRLQKYRIGLLIVTLILGIHIWKAGDFVNFKPLQAQRTYKILPVFLLISSLASPNTSEAVNNISGIERIDAFVTEQDEAPRRACLGRSCGRWQPSDFHEGQGSEVGHGHLCGPKIVIKT